MYRCRVRQNLTAHVRLPGYVRTYIVLPSTIYGVASNALTEAGVQNPYSIQIPTLIRAAVSRGQAGMVGEGAALWNNVHIDDGMFVYCSLEIDLRNYS